MVDSNLILNMKKAQWEKAKKAYEDGFLDINGRKYSIIENITHEQREELYQLHSEYQAGAKIFNYANVRVLLNNICTCDGQLMKNCLNHFVKYPEDFEEYCSDMLEVAVYPFLQGKITRFLNQSENQKESL